MVECLVYTKESVSVCVTARESIKQGNLQLSPGFGIFSIYWRSGHHKEMADKKQKRSSTQTSQNTEEQPTEKRGRERTRVEKPPSDEEPKPKRPRGRPKGSFKVKKEVPPKPKAKRKNPRKAANDETEEGESDQ